MPLVRRRRFLSLLAGTPALAMNPSQAADAASLAMAHVPWSRHAAIYEVNVRQFSAEGTLRAAAAELPRLKALGIDILWLMPLQPIGTQARKGTLGSYYSIRDYTAVNPEFGTLADARAYVRAAHTLGMRVILDWVANHTAFDHPWTRDHKDWYKLDAHGEVFPVTFNAGQPGEEHWSDVTALDYDRPALRDAMIAAMQFWVREADIDGFRCDVAGLVPIAFWERARRELDAVKPMFMLAEADAPALHHGAFDMTYSWDLAALFHKIGQGKADAGALRDWVAREPHGFPASAYRMRFTTNHDFNSWNGTDAELYGDFYLPLAVLTFTLPGMPLVYNGQESRLAKRLEFFEKDPIAWKSHELEPFYARLLALKHGHPALANGQYGGALALVDVGNDRLFAFRRTLDADSVGVVVNLTRTAQSFRLGESDRSLPPAGWLIETT
jgi:glycosidase